MVDFISHMLVNKILHKVKNKKKNVKEKKIIRKVQCSRCGSEGAVFSDSLTLKKRLSCEEVVSCRHCQSIYAHNSSAKYGTFTAGNFNSVMKMMKASKNISALQFIRFAIE